MENFCKNGLKLMQHEEQTELFRENLDIIRIIDDLKTIFSETFYSKNI